LAYPMPNKSTMITIILTTAGVICFAVFFKAIHFFETI